VIATFGRLPLSSSICLKVAGRGVSLILVRLDIQNSYDNPVLFGPGDRYFASKLILLVILTFSHTVHVGLMDAVDLVLAVPLLAEDLFKQL
jgi:hypothetical protein